MYSLLLLVDSCKCKWKSIRSSYIRHLKKKGKKDYYLAKYLQFLTPFTKFRKKISAQDSEELINIQRKDNDSDFENDLIKDDPSDSEMKTNLKRKLSVEFENNSASELHKRKKYVNIEHLKEQHKSFLLSLYPYIETFSEEEFNHFQTGVLSLINKIKHRTT